MSVVWIVVFLPLVYSATVTTPLGQLEGSHYVTNSGKQVYTFYGVPYAKPPVGDNRFKEPKPLRSWLGVWSAKQLPAECFQYGPDLGKPPHVQGSEDCLYLNIYTQSLTNTSNLPVLVFFHGGAFMMGTGNYYKPTYLLERNDIVYVSVNYRLGPFGFLSTQDNVVPGNNGLKDQVLALKWVQDYIANFGGDKDKVTISGNSAGGASVHIHYLSPLSRGLFSKGISSSGSALMPWALADEPLLKAKMLSNSLGCLSDSTQIMIKCLRQRSSVDIYSKTEELFQPWMFNPFSPFGPVVENTTRQPFLNKHPYQQLVEGDVYDRPLLASLTKDEGLYPTSHFIHRQDHLKFLNENWLSIFPHLLDYNFTVSSDDRNFISEKIRVFYFNNQDISTETRDNVVKMLGDRMFNADMYSALRLHASSVKSSVQLYIFAYRGSTSLTEMFTNTTVNFGVSHFDDMYYLLAPFNSDSKLVSEADQRMIVTLTDIWAGFIKSAEPTLPVDTPWEPISPDAQTTGEVKHLVIRSFEDIHLVTEQYFGNYDFWSTLGLLENIKYNAVIGIKDEL